MFFPQQKHNSKKTCIFATLKAKWIYHEETVFITNDFVVVICWGAACRLL